MVVFGSPVPFMFHVFYTHMGKKQIFLTCLTFPQIICHWLGYLVHLGKPVFIVAALGGLCCWAPNWSYTPSVMCLSIAGASISHPASNSTSLLTEWDDVSNATNLTWCAEGPEPDSTTGWVLRSSADHLTNIYIQWISGSLHSCSTETQQAFKPDYCTVILTSLIIND